MSDDRIERVARAICEADGEDPEAQVSVGRLETVRRGNALVQEQPTKPTWTKYEKEAQRFIAALDAAARR